MARSPATWAPTLLPFSWYLSTIYCNSSLLNTISPALGTSDNGKFAGVAFINIFSPGN